MRTIFLILLTFVVAPAYGDIFSYTDEAGVVHFSNVPVDSQYHLILRVASDHPKLAKSETSHKKQLLSVKRKQYSNLVDEAARENQLDPALLHAVIAAESGYNPNAVSPKGAVGLMQMMPDTGRRYGVQNLYDPTQNVKGGAQYLRDLMDMFNQDVSLAVAAYNAGEQAVTEYGNHIPPYRETAAYVPRVLSYYRQFRDDLK